MSPFSVPQSFAQEIYYWFKDYPLTVESGQWPPQCSLPELFLRNHLPSQKLIYSSWSEVKWSEVAQSYLTLCDPMDCSLQTSSIHGIFQASVLEWVAISFSRETSQSRNRTQVSCMQADSLLTELWGKPHSHVQFFVSLGAVAYQAPLSMGFPKQEYWSGLPFPSPGDRPNPGIEPRSPTLQADALTSEPPGKPIPVEEEAK